METLLIVKLKFRYQYILLVLRWSEISACGEHPNHVVKSGSLYTNTLVIHPAPTLHEGRLKLIFSLNNLFFLLSYMIKIWIQFLNISFFLIFHLLFKSLLLLLFRLYVLTFRLFFSYFVFIFHLFFSHFVLFFVSSVESEKVLIYLYTLRPFPLSTLGLLC